MSMEAVKEMVGYDGYAPTKPSGAEWLGPVPEHWRCQALGTILQLKSVKNRPDWPVLSVYREYGVIPKDSRDDNHNATSLDTTNYKAVEPGDLVINKMKAWQGSMGVSAYRGIVSPAYITCSVTSNEVHGAFLHQLLRSDQYIGAYNTISDGVRIGQWDMRYEDLKRLPVLLPPLPEQTRIATFLDRKCGQIDQAIAQKERLIALLKERRQVLVQQAVTKGLDPKAKMKDSGVGWLGEVPAHWEVRRLKSEIDLLTGNPFPSEHYTDEGIPLARGINVKEGVFNWDAKKCWPSITRDIQQFALRADDVLISMDGSKVGKNFCIVQEADLPVLLNQRVARLRVKSGLNAKYLFWNLACVNFLTWVSISKTDPMVPHIAPSDIRGFVVALPPVAEQQEITNYLDRAEEKHLQALNSFEAQIAKLKEYRSILINAAVTGKIKVPEE